MRISRPLIAICYDTVAAIAAFWGALFIRYDGSFPKEAETLPYYSASYALFSVAIFYMMGLHRNIWRYTSTRDLMRLMNGIFLALFMTLSFLFILTRLEFFPRTAFIIIFLLHMALCAGPRALLRTIYDRPFKHGWPSVSSDIKNVLLIDGGDAADLFIRECTRQHPKQFNIIGILDDDTSKQGRSIHSIPILGGTANLAQTLDRYKSIHTIVITDKRPASSINSFISIARERDVAVKRLPNLSQLEEGEKLTSLKPVAIEDLLGRDAISTDMSKIRNLIEDKVVFVTGAGGSIGSEVCRQIASRKPKKLIVSDHSELALYQIDMEIKQAFPEVTTQALLLDVKNEHDVKSLLSTHTPDIIFHAAAYKHVPIVEENAVAGIQNNLFGTATVAKSAMAESIPHLVIISTDKAVNPTNVMGATKRAAEIYCQNLKGETKITTVRFGNVLGSTGSVVPLFTKQIENGGPITVTHKDVTRYFMTIPEAVQLVLQASTASNGGEIFMLDMGKPVKIWDMAEEMIRLSGLEPHVDIHINEIGLRPGEKMFEELWYDAEGMDKTDQEKIFLAHAVSMNKQELEGHMNAIQAACANDDATGAVNALKAFVKEYNPADNSPFSNALKNK